MKKNIMLKRRLEDISEEEIECPPEEKVKVMILPKFGKSVRIELHRKAVSPIKMPPPDLGFDSRDKTENKPNYNLNQFNFFDSYESKKKSAFHTENKMGIINPFEGLKKINDNFPPKKIENPFLKYAMQEGNNDGPVDFMPNKPCDFMPNEPCDFMPNKPCDFLPNKPCDFVPNKPCDFVPNKPCVFLPNKPCDFLPNKPINSVSNNGPVDFSLNHGQNASGQSDSKFFSNNKPDDFFSKKGQNNENIMKDGQEYGIINDELNGPDKRPKSCQRYNINSSLTINANPLLARKKYTCEFCHQKFERRLIFHKEKSHPKDLTPSEMVEVFPRQLEKLKESFKILKFYHEKLGERGLVLPEKEKIKRELDYFSTIQMPGIF